MNLIEKAFRDASRESWKEKMVDQEKVYLLEGHVGKMKSILSDLNYETYCVDRLIENTSKMDLERAERYTNLMESIACFYSDTLNKETAAAIITGLVARAKDVGEAERYYSTIVYKLDGRMATYRKRVFANNSRLGELNSELARSRSGIFRIFRRKKAEVLGHRIGKLESKTKRNMQRLEKTKKLVDRIRIDRP